MMQNNFAAPYIKNFDMRASKTSGSTFLKFPIVAFSNIQHAQHIFYQDPILIFLTQLHLTPSTPILAKSLTCNSTIGIYHTIFSHRVLFQYMIEWDFNFLVYPFFLKENHYLPNNLLSALLLYHTIFGNKIDFSLHHDLTTFLLGMLLFH